MSKLLIRDYPVSAGVPLRIDQPSAFFQLMASTDPVDIEVLRAESVIGTAEGVSLGFSFGGPAESQFHAVSITSATSQTLKLCFATGSVDLRAVVGSVNVLSLPDVVLTANNGALTCSTANIATSAATIVAANAARRFLSIQNRDPLVNVYLRVDGTAATVAGATVKLAPGDSITYDAWVPTGAVSVIGDAVGTVPLVIQEG